MKQLENGTPANGFSEALIGQLGFIRKHRRYPFSRRTLLPLLTVLATAPLLLGFALFMFRNAPKNQSSGQWLPLLFLAMCVPAVAAALRFRKSLRFAEIRSKQDLGGNMLMLERFLRESRFAYSRHPEAPEVFSIVSTPIRAMNGEREVVIFVADSGRILINSHFTMSRYRAFIGQVRYAELARNLEAWIKAKTPVGSEVVVIND